MGWLLVPLWLAMLALGVAQIWLGFVGIEHHLGVWWATGAVALAFVVRIMLPLTIGTYFGAVDVLGWPWWVGVLVAAPGIIFMVPALIAWFIAAIKSLGRS